MPGSAPPRSNDFTPGSGSIALNRVTSIHQTRDLAGYYLSTDATALASLGALQPTPTIAVTWDGSSVSDGGTVTTGSGSHSVVATNGGLAGSVLYISALTDAGGVSSSGAPIRVTSGGTNASPTYTASVTASGSNTITHDASDGSFLITVTMTGGTSIIGGGIGPMVTWSD